MNQTFKTGQRAAGFSIFAQIGEANGGSRQAEWVFERLMQSALNTSEWREISNLIVTMSRQLTEAAKGFRGSRYSADPTRVTNDDNCVAWQVAQATREGRQGWSLRPLPWLTIRVFATQWNRTAGASLEFTFEDVAQGNTMRQAIEKVVSSLHGLESDLIIIESTIWESAFTLKANDPRDWLFAHGSRELLAERVTTSSGDGWSAPALRIAPLPGEKLIVYDNSVGLGYHEPWTQHPELGVFASVGPFSLRVVRAKGYGPKFQDTHDRIEVFLDSALPIAPPEKNETGYYGDDYGDPADREVDDYED